MTTKPTKSHGIAQSDSKSPVSFFLMASLISLTFWSILAFFSSLSCFLKSF